MLFDLRGRRKRLIQVIYVFLALLLGGSLVFFGIGGDAPGGLGDAIGISPNSGSGNSGLDSEIEDAEAALEANPNNQAALLTLARSQVQAGNIQLEEEDGQVVVTDEAASSYEASVAAWERYLAATKGKPRDTAEVAAVGTQVIRAYETLAFATDDPVLIQRRLDGAVETLSLVTKENPNPNALFQLAAFAYLAGDEKAAEGAGKQALKEVDDAGREALEAQLNTAKRQGKALQRQIKASESQGGDGENPLGDIDLGSDPSTGG